MAIQCPYCNKELKDGARFCTGCGRQLGGESTDVAATALSDLKQCYGSFPTSKMDCYLCADEGKCSSFTTAQRLATLEEAVQAVQGSMAQLNDSLVTVNDNVVSQFDRAIHLIDLMNTNICKGLGR